MRCFIMKARTLNDMWFQFTINDVPTRFNPTEFALLKCPSSPRLLLNSIRRGDPDTGLCEGDIIDWKNERWLVCYERGFYVINESYITQTFDKLDDFNIVGDCFSSEFPIPILKRNKCLFKYNDTVFRLEDIVGAFGEDSIILRSLRNPVLISAIQQDAGIMKNKQRLYFGDMTEHGVVDLYKGRVVYRTDNTITDAITGGLM